MNISYIINHLGEERNNYFNAIAPPIIQSSNFAFKNVAKLKANLADELNHPFYTRGNNPTVAILRKKLAALAQADNGLVLSSGSGAIAAAVAAHVQQGNHVVCVAKPYSWTYKLLTNLLSKFGVTTTFVDGTNVANIENAIKPNTQIIYLESPNSLTFEMQDLAEISKLAAQKGITTICDNSYNTDLHQSPIALGIDIVVHSASKYYGGHSDVVAGVIAADQKTIQHIFESTYMTFGACISPHDAWLILRSLRTLPIRLERIANTAKKVVTFLENHKQVNKVNWPFAAGNTQTKMAQKQMCKAGGLLSFELKAKNTKEIETFVDTLQYFHLATSWGGHESLVFPMSVFHESDNPTYKVANQALPWNLVRLYCGLEDADVLINDLKQALALF